MNSKDNINKELFDYALDLMRHKPDFEMIEIKLATKTENNDQINEIIKQLKKIRHEERRKTGLQKLALGSVLLVVGFLITAVNFHSNQSFTLVMYGFTTIGISLMLWGVYEIIG